MNRYERAAYQAAALARMSEARALATMANDRGMTCAGCRANHQNGNRADRTCAEFRGDGLCQKQVYERVMVGRLEVGNE